MTQTSVKQIPGPGKIYGRVTKSGERMTWTLAEPAQTDAPVYVSDKGHRTTICSGAIACLLRDGRMVSRDGKEILAWGDEFGAQLERLGIDGLLIYNGGADDPSVYWLADSDFDKLCADDEENWHGVGACWRYADGATPMVHLHEPKRVHVAGHYLEAWKDAGPYDDLLTYLCDAMGCSTERNVAAVTAELAKMNGMSLGALFTKYQPVEGSVATND